MADAFVTLEVDLAALDDLGVQEEVVRHHHGAQDAHDDEHRTLGHRGHHSGAQGLAPVDMHEEELVNERQSYDGDKANDGALYLLI